MRQINTIEYKTIEWLRFSLAVAVVLLHTYYLEVLSCGSHRFIPNFLSAGLCRVAVPTFYIISGYLFFQGLERWDWTKWKEKLTRRIKTLLIPYVLWNILALIAQYARMHFKGIPFAVTGFLSERGWLRIFWDSNRVGGSSFKNILGYEMYNGGMPIDNALWFIRDLMVVCVAAPFIYWFVKKTGIKGLSVILLLALLSIWIPFDGFSVVAFLFFSIGAYVSINGKGLIQFCTKYGKVSLITSIILLVCLMLSFYICKSAYGYVCTLFTVSGSIATIYLSSKLIELGKVKVNSTLSSTSFFIYALHMATLMSFVGMITTRVVPPNSAVGYLFDYFFITIMTIAICLFLFFIMKKFCPHLLSLLIGGRIR